MAHPAHKTSNIIIQTANPVLARLLDEQLSALKNVTSSAELPVDCLIYDESSPNSPRPEKDDRSAVLLIPKGPISLGALLDQLKYILSGRESHVEDESTAIEIFPFLLHPAHNTLTHLPSGEIIHLTDKERLLLRTLYGARETGMPRADLLKSIWGYAAAVETHTLETHVYRLRQKLERFKAQDMVKVIEGRYMLDIKKPA